MTDAAAAALKAACGTDVSAGEPLKTSTNTACADEIVAILDDKTRALTCRAAAVFPTVTTRS